MTLTIQKIDYGAEYDENGEKAKGTDDFKLLLIKDKQTIAEFDTGGWCDRYHETSMPPKEPYDREDLKRWKRIVKREAIKSLKSGEEVEIENIDRPLGRCYGNTVWTGRKYTPLDGTITEVGQYRGSNTWGVWQDIGMSGEASDFTAYIHLDIVQKEIEKMIDNIETFFGFDFNDLEELQETANETCDYVFYEGWAVPEIVEEIEGSGEPIIIYVWDESESNEFMVYDSNLTENKRKIALERFEIGYDKDGDGHIDYSELRSLLWKSKTISELIEKLQPYYEY